MNHSIVRSHHVLSNMNLLGWHKLETINTAISMLAATDAQILKMPHNQHFIHSLVEMREHYQALQIECDRACSHATIQLDRINALVVDQLAENQHVESLLKLRTHYQTLYAQQQQKAQSAKAQIAHINALIADQVVLQHNEQQITFQSTTVEHKHLNEGLTQVTDESEQSSQQAAEQLEKPDSLKELAQPTPLDSTQEKQDTEEPSLSQPEIQTSTSIPEEQHSESDLPIASLNTEHPNASDRPQQSRSLKTPLLPQYQDLSKSEAVEQLLQENEESILHVDYIIRALHGELEPEDLKAEKPRMNDTLRKGVEKGLWDKVPDAAGCYTVDLKLVEQKSQRTKAQDAGGTSAPLLPVLPLLPRYRDMSFTGAVETVVRENAGEILTPETAARALYGEIEGKALTQAKAKVGKILWNGAKQGRWQSVPGRLGAYTLK